MNKKVIYGGICAATLVFTAAISVVSCSNDDEYYAGGNYTLAKQRVTRGVEPTQPVEAVCKDTLHTSYDFHFERVVYGEYPVYVDATVYIMTYKKGEKPIAEMQSYSIKSSTDPFFRVTGVSFKQEFFSRRYRLYAYGADNEGMGYEAMVEDRVFD